MSKQGTALKAVPFFERRMSMYVVSLFSRNREYTAKFNTEAEACRYASIFWHLSPRVTAPDGKPVLAHGSVDCIDSEY